MKKLIGLLLLITTIVYGQDAARVLQGSAQPPLPFNMIPESGFENRTTGWSATGGVFTATSTPADVARGSYSGKWTPPASTAAGVLFQSNAISIPVGLYNHDCKAQMWFRGQGATNGTFNIEVYDGTNILGTASIPDATYYQQVQSASFTCPTSGTLRLRVRNTATTVASPTAMYFDDAIITDTSWLGVGSALTGVSTFGSTPNSSGASVSGNSLVLQPASDTYPGGVTTGAQTFAGAKTFSSAIIAALTGNVTGNLTGNVTGNVTGDVTGNADTATALAANPTDCGVGEFANAIAANGNLTCAAPTDAGITELAGDVLAGPGSGSQFATLSSTGVTPNTYTNATVAVDAKGRITSAASGTAPVTEVSGIAPITSSGGPTPTIQIVDAVANGSTKGASSYDPDDFDSSSGNISIDYVNGQKADNTNNGFLTTTDWTNFDAKLTDPLTTKGDLLTRSTVTTRLGVGTDNFCLQADSTTATGLKWAACPGAGGSGITIGDVVGSSAGNTILYSNGTANLAESANFLFDGSSLQLTGSSEVIGTTTTTGNNTVTGTSTLTGLVSTTSGFNAQRSGNDVTPAGSFQKLNGAAFSNSNTKVVDIYGGASATTTGDMQGLSVSMAQSIVGQSRAIVAQVGIPDSGASNSQVGVDVDIQGNSPSDVSLEAIGIRIGAPDQGTYGSWTGLLIEQSAGTVSGNNRAISVTSGESYFGGNVKLNGETASTIASFDASKNIKSLSTATYPTLTELSYVKGAAANLQTQISARAPIASPSFTGTASADIISIAGGSLGDVLKISNQNTGTAGYAVGISTSETNLAGLNGSLNIINTANITSNTNASPVGLTLDNYKTGTANLTGNMIGATFYNRASEAGSISSIYGVKAGTILESTSSTSSVYDFYSTMQKNNTAAITNKYGFYVSNPIGAGTVTNQYGLYIEPLTGSTINRAIHVAGGDSFFGDNISQDGSADEVQLNVQGHSTQTSNILNVEKSDGTDLLSVTNVNGTKIKGTTTNDAAATGEVGEIVSSGLSNGSATSLTTGTSKTVTSISLTAGDWKICGGVQFATAASTSITALHVGSSLTTNAMPAASAYMNPISNELAAERDMAATVPGSNAWIDLSFPCYRASIAATTTFYLVSRATFTVSTMSVWGFIQGERIR